MQPSPGPADAPVEPLPSPEVDAVASWLKTAFILQVLMVPTWWCCLPSVADRFWPRGLEFLYLLLPLGGLVTPGIVLAGIRALLARSSYPVALLGLQILLVLGVVAWLQSFVVGLLYGSGFLGPVTQWSPSPLCFETCVLGLPAVAGLVSLIASVRGLLVLHRPEVLAGFSREARQ